MSNTFCFVNLYLFRVVAMPIAAATLEFLGCSANKGKITNDRPAQIPSLRLKKFILMNINY